MAALKRYAVPVDRCFSCLKRFISEQSEKCSQNAHKPLSISRTLRRNTPEAYRRLRDIVIEFQRASSLGYDEIISKKEEVANKIIMNEKMAEYKKGILDPTKFSPGFHIFQVLSAIKESRLFSMLQKMPKGGALHAHDTALCSTEFLIKLTYRKNLWICTADEGCKAIGFRFSKDKPTMKAIADCTWEPMSEFRERRGDENVRNYLFRRFSMYPFASFTSNNQAWMHFMGIFILLDGLLLYAPIWGDYYYNALKEFYEDGVQYLEVRSLLPKLYCLDGTMLEMRDTVQIYKDQMEKFMSKNPGFIGSKLIYAPLRGVKSEVVDQYVKDCAALNKEFSTFLIGFDLVGQEELGRPLIDFISQLVKIPYSVNFYFHAGETNWFGSSIDENLIDAVLLGTKRIGHGYAITKHPFLMKLAKNLNIALEVCPVSNQVLQLGQDYRNHPAATLMAQNVPMVISSDDPSFWRATPLSHDFYMAFLGIAPMNADLKFLKRIARNSITYSALTKEEKCEAIEKWTDHWDKWIEDIVQNKKETDKC